MGQPSPRGEKGSAQSLSSRFPHSFQPNLAKLVEETVVVPNSSGAADDEDMLEERSPKKFDTYEDIPTEFKRNLIPTKPVPRPLPSPLAPLASVVGLENHPKTLAITIKPPKLLPFNGQIPLLIFQQWQRGGKRKKVGGGDGGLIVSREQENPKTEGQPSAIVGGDGKPSGAPRIKNNFNNAKKSQPPAYKTAPPPSLLPPAIRYGHLGAQQPYPSADGTGYATTNPFQKHSSAASCICPTSCGGPCSNCANGCPFSACCACDCGQSGGWQFPGGNSCCDDHRSNNCAAQCCGGAGRASSNCRIRLIIACCPRPCARHLLTNRNRVLFTRRRLRRCIGIFEGMVQEAGRNNGGQTKINFEDDKSQERRRRRLWPTSARRNGSQ